MYAGVERMPCTVAGDHKREPLGVGTPRRVSASAKLWERSPALGIGREDPLDDARLVRIHLDQGWVAGPLGADPVGIRDPRGPGQQLAGFHLGQPTASHAVGDQGPCILGHRPADVGHELLVRIMAGRAADEHHLDSGPLPSLEYHQSMDEVPRQTIRCGDHHHVELGPPHVVAQGIQSGPLQTSTAVAVVKEDVLLPGAPSPDGGRRRPTTGSPAARSSAPAAADPSTPVHTLLLASGAPP
jgi:hypothetical protein